MTTFQRFDKATFARAVKTDAGFLKAPAKLTRTGVFEYLTSDGTKIRELRLPEEVFNADTMESFKLAPLTDDHPYQHGGVVNSDNARQLAVGSVGEPVRNGQYVEAEILVTDAAVVEKILSGSARELSCGYYCDREEAPAGSVWRDDSGKEWPYDFVQRNIRGNHVAVVARGRAGSEVRVQLDSAAAIQVDADEPVVEETPKMNEQELAALKLELDKATARADSAEAKIKSLEESLAVANDPKRIADAVTARVALETKAKSAVSDLSLDGLSDAEIKRTVVAKLNDSVKLDGKSDEYVNAAFELLTENKIARKNPATEAAAQAIAAEPVSELKADSSTTPEEEFRKRFFGLTK